MGILTSVLGTAFYVQVAPDRLMVRNTKSGMTFSEPPEVAMVRGPKIRVLGIGTGARPHASEPGVELVNPFGHPRSLVSDFTAGEQLLKAAIARVVGNFVIAMAPRVVMHPLGDPAGGFTQVEIRALYEMAIGAGASEAKVWQGRVLTDQEVRSGTFPSDGRVLS